MAENDDAKNLATLVAIAGGSPEQIERTYEMALVVHHVPQEQAEAQRSGGQRVKSPTCGAGPGEWRKAHWDWDKVDCPKCLERKA